MKGAGGERNQTPGPGLISKVLKPDGSTGISIQSCKQWTSGLFQGSTDFLLLRIGVSDAHTKENLGFPYGSDGKESTCNAADPGSIPWLGRSPEEGNGNPFQYYCLGNPMDRGAWRAIVHGVAKESDTT